VKSEYSQIQYHWCPTAFSVSAGLWNLSIRFISHRNGIAVITRMIAGAVVQIVSIICPSSMNCLVYLFQVSIIIMYITVVIIISIIIRVWDDILETYV